MVESVKGGGGRGQVAASTGGCDQRGRAGEAPPPLGGGRPPARVEAEQARGQDTQLEEDHSRAWDQ